jgi:hypothetical protein
MKRASTVCRCHPPAISDGTVRTLTLGLADPATAPRSGAAAGARPQVRTAAGTDR